MTYNFNTDPRSLQLLASAFASGCVLHILLYRRGEWDLLALPIVQAYAALPIIVTGITRLAEARGLLNDTSLTFTAIMVLEITHIAGIFSSILIYRILFHPLNCFPGPLIARISNFYPTYLRMKNLRLFEEVQDLHHRHGDFVRLGKPIPQSIPIDYLLTGSGQDRQKYLSLTLRLLKRYTPLDHHVPKVHSIMFSTLEFH